MKNKMPYSVPEGYFNELSARLSGIPAAEAAARTPFRVAARPYFALAAIFAAALVLGNVFLGRQQADVQCSDEDIIEYLIDSGTTLAQIEYCSIEENY